MNKTKLSGGLLLVAMVSAFGGWPAMAQHVPKDHFETLAAASDIVVVGRVVENDARWIRGHIVTTSEVAVVESLKGSRAGDTVDVATLGGTVDNIRERVRSAPELRVGETSILFLKRAETILGERGPHFRIVSERGVVLLLRSGDRESRLENNRRLRRYIEEIAVQARRSEAEP